MIGIISDTHDDMAQIARVVELFNQRGVSHVLHAGDLVSPFTFEVLGGLRASFSGIYGNNDGDRILLKEKSGGSLHIQPLMLTAGEKKFAIVHEPLAVDALALSGLYDVVVYGHTHTPDVRKVKETVVINPGKVARLHKGKSTAALLETGTMAVEIIEL
ncbi:MAG: metallophosphoesterase [Nitrospirota bacterium]